MADVLTRREVEVLTQLAKGKTARQIAEILGITKRTVDAHLQSMYSKLGASNGAHAVAIALRDGIIESK